MTKWTENEIAQGIFEAMETLQLKRMPSRSEIESVFGDTRLTNKISRSGIGYYGWAGKLGLKTKSSETKTGKTFEFKAEDIILDHYPELRVEQMSQNYPFDILLEGALKIDVKVGKVHEHFGCSAYTFRTGKKYGSCDIYLCFGIGEDEEIKDIYLIPASVAKTTTINVTFGGKNKYAPYKNAWQMIGDMLISTENIIEKYKNVQKEGKKC